MYAGVIPRYRSKVAAACISLIDLNTRPRLLSLGRASSNDLRKSLQVLPNIVIAFTCANTQGHNTATALTKRGPKTVIIEDF